MDNTKLRMTRERIDYLERTLDVKRALLGRATDKGNRYIIDRIKEETKGVERELYDAHVYLDALEKLQDEEYTFLDQQDLMAK